MVASRYRFVVLGLICSLSFVLYLDRVCMSQALEPIRLEMGLTYKQMSYVLIAFTLAYGLAEMPVGYWGDRIGAKRVLIRIVICWSLFTVLTAGCWNLATLLLVRFCFGIGEAGAYPNVARVIERWFPIAEKGRVQGFFMTCAMLGGAVAPIVAALLISWFNWRVVFLVFGALGVVWVVVFRRLFRDDPATHPSVNAMELMRIEAGKARAGLTPPGVPWRSAFANRTLWLLALIMICGAFNGYLYSSWYSTYLQKGRGVGQQEAGALASMVLLFGAAGMLASGFLVDILTRRVPGHPRSRTLLGFLAFTIGAVLTGLSIVVDSPRLAALCLALSCLAIYSQQSSWWSSLTEISGPFTGTFFGMANGLGVFGAMASTYFVGAYADHRGELGFTEREQWDGIFYGFIGVQMVAALAWLGVDSRKWIGAGKMSELASE